MCTQNRDNERECLKCMLTKLITMLSHRVQILRETMLQEERNKDRLMKSTGDDWRKSKFVISGIRTQSCIRNLVRDIDDLFRFAANINCAS